MAMDWDKVRIFFAAAEAGSFTHAGTALGLSQSAVSRQVSALEIELKIPLTKVCSVAKDKDYQQILFRRQSIKVSVGGNVVKVKGSPLSPMTIPTLLKVIEVVV